ncbi:HIT family protein [Campylobacter sp. Cr9]|uniref:HIT family protein n=1 Tax=Campylobacter sp. Cr9 TaxID=2735728 RepID=UPI0030146E9C|nr:HIT family protein [Campylobacter sp. Cr9]
MIYENNFCYIKSHESNIPWLEIHAKDEYKELSNDYETSLKIFKLAMFIEQIMIEFYNPTKINHASFANYLPKAHWHVMARFSDDGFYPECMWGKQQNELKNYRTNFDEFCSILAQKLSEFKLGI